MSVTVPAAPDPTIDFLGLFADQTEDVILVRMADWANEGLDPVENADQWVDTREGSHWYTCVFPVVRELARVYDALGTEVPMSAFLLWAWGTYLDDLAAAYDIDRKAATPAEGVETFSGPAGTDIALGTTLSVVPDANDDSPPTFTVTTAGTIPDAGAGVGTLDLGIVAEQAGVAGNVGANAITAPSTPLPPGVTFTNAAPTRGGTDPETDEQLRERVLEAILGEGGANVAAYIRWASAWPGVGAVKVVPTPTGPNSVLVLITDPQGEPLPADVVASLQADLDPTAGQGSGTAPVGARVNVETSTPLVINVAAAVTYENGYSAAGAGNTVALHGPIAAAIAAYMQTIKPGGEAVVAHVAGIIATWPGVHDVSGVQLNGAAANVPVTLAPPEAAQLGTLTI